MKVKLYTVAAITVFLAALTANTKVYTNSNAAPPGTSGDPVNNFTCASGPSCHGSNTLDGASVIGVKIGSSAGNVVDATSAFVPAPNTEYFLNIILNTNQGLKYGFALSALNSSNQQAGTFTITNANQTGKNNVGSIEYVTSRNASQTKSWFMKWTSPATVSGPITFYATANVGDGNGNATGDLIYKRAVTINGSGTSVETINSFANVSLFPNPATENITLNYNLLSEGYVSAQVMSEEGKIVKQLFGEHQSVGVMQSIHNISELPAGKYFVHISSSGKSSVKPFVKY